MIWWIIAKIVGLVLVGLGAFFVFLGPGPSVGMHQPAEFGVASIIAGVIMLLVGIYLLLS